MYFNRKRFFLSVQYENKTHKHADKVQLIYKAML